MALARTLIIGDIHGRVESLKGVLSLAAFDGQKDRLICIGDYVDYGQYSYEVVEYLIQLQAQSERNHIYLAGNHDAWFSKVLTNSLALFHDQEHIEQYHWNWFIQGGVDTYNSYIQYTPEDWLRHKESFYDKLQLFYLEDNILYVHAGYDPDLGFEETLLKLGGKELLWNRSLYREALAFQKSVDRGKSMSHKDYIFNEFHRIFTGHTPTVIDGILKPTPMGKVINVDQGCKIDGRLTAWVLEEDSYIQYIPPPETNPPN